MVSAGMYSRVRLESGRGVQQGVGCWAEDGSQVTANGEEDTFTQHFYPAGRNSSSRICLVTQQPTMGR